ncbi:hypothetical protein [Pedobacter endophyticus]|uniref:Acetyltransferase (GNAT) domain-containing protein n=1 Tax=Pedobacter endophyticus TaxID=2789740 RepID=A0A7U3Q447_9SPHI|nr:hypothetical protein [Pedobacter endophyticus]QPH38260.1 hypothetical protein IZT61_14300 [Pedobacter endophyticus]
MVINLCSSVTEYESLSHVYRSEDGPDGYLINLLEKGPQYYIDGFNSEFKLLVVNDKIIPIVINQGKDKSSYLSALSVHYIKHGIDSVKEKVKSRLLYGSLQCLGIILNALLNLVRINKAVYVNCWIIPTGASVYLNNEELLNIREFFQGAYKSYAIIFKGVNNYLHFEGMSLPNSNCLTNRIVYAVDMDEEFLKKSDIKKAIKANAKTTYLLTQGDQLKSIDMVTIRHLYNQLYFGKHSKYSLPYNQQWFEMIRALPFFKLQAFKNSDQEVVAFTVTFLDNGSIISSLGACKQNTADYFHLYTLNFAIRVLDAKTQHKNLNYSSGGDEFKKNRGGIARAEYDLIYFDHLSLIKKSIWRFFISICNKTIMYLNK